MLFVMKQMSNIYSHMMCIGTFLLFQLFYGQAFASGLKSDETVLFFTVDAYKKTTDTVLKEPKPSKAHLQNFTNTIVLNENNHSIWLVPLHAWVYEQEKDSFWRTKLTHEIAEEIGLQENSPEYENLQNTLTMFLVDSESFKTLELQVNGQAVIFGRSSFNGHIQNTIEVSSNRKDISLDVHINETVLSKEAKQRKGLIRLIPNQGVSIISDIDDTIKDSHVLDKKELIKNTFLRPAKPVKFMNDWYQNMLKHYSSPDISKAYFHYVSASPWQLYPALNQFLQQHDFPSGSLYLRQFRIKDRSVLDFLRPSTEYKVETISRLIKQYPGRYFILIGDSGEHDPEIYGRIITTYPAQVKMIYIRKVPGSDLSKQRFSQAFGDIGSGKWQLFEEQNLPDFPF